MSLSKREIFLIILNYTQCNKKTNNQHIIPSEATIMKGIAILLVIFFHSICDCFYM